MLLEQIMRSAQGLPMVRGIEFGNPLSRGTDFNPAISDENFMREIGAIVNNLPTNMATEPQRVNAPISAPDAPSVPVPAGAYPNNNRKRRGGILGALESVFMPEPDSRWAAALRGGIWDAKANQAAYKQAQATGQADLAKKEIERQMAEAKLKNLLNKGEYQIAGNNLIHFKPDGGDPEIITPPQTPTETQRLIDMWKNAETQDIKDLIKGILLKGNDPAIISLKGSIQSQVAEDRAAATARHRAPPRARASDSGLSLPPGAKVLK